MRAGAAYRRAAVRRVLAAELDLVHHDPGRAHSRHPGRIVGRRQRNRARPVREYRQDSPAAPVPEARRAQPPRGREAHPGHRPARHILQRALKRGTAAGRITSETEKAMAYGHAERNLALLRQLETETRQLLASLDPPDPEQSAWLQEVTSRSGSRPARRSAASALRTHPGCRR